MKTVYCIVLLALAGVLFNGCSKDDDKDVGDTYVRHNISGQFDTNLYYVNVSDPIVGVTITGLNGRLLGSGGFDLNRSYFSGSVFDSESSYSLVFVSRFRISNVTFRFSSSDDDERVTGSVISSEWQTVNEDWIDELFGTGTEYYVCRVGLSFFRAVSKSFICDVTLVK
jgi:hypothetical protein